MIDTTRRTRLLTFDAGDFAWSYLAIALGAIGILALTVVVPAVRWATGQPLSVPILMLESEHIPGAAAAGGTLRVDSATAELPNASTGAWLVHLGMGLAFSAAALVVLALLWRFAWSVQLGSPFTEANVRRLQAMAAVLLGGAVVGHIVGGFANAYLLNEAMGTSVMFAARFEAVGLQLAGFGAILALISEVFRRGVKLEADVDGLV